MARNIVVCCDGTSNQYGPENTNVLRLYSVLDRSPAKQAIFYDPGVGTFSAQPMLTQAGTRAQRLMGLAFGRGLTKNVKDAYRFLMDAWEPGDSISLFGFSRGAYTVRVLAGMLHKVGLLYADNHHLVDYADQIYKNEKRPEVYEGFKRTFCRSCPVHFMGIWDTVSSVGWVYDPVVRPFTANNPSVSIVRHAVAIDERRAFFRQNLWSDQLAGVDLKQVWFAGCHSDIGGANPLSKIALEWMLVEASSHGLVVNRKAARSLLDSPRSPNALDPMVESLTAAWKACEYVPKWTWDPASKKKRLRANRGKTRWIDMNATVHESALQRQRAIGYSPPNFPSDPQMEPWVTF